MTLKGIASDWALDLAVIGLVVALIMGAVWL